MAYMRDPGCGWHNDGKDAHSVQDRLLTHCGFVFLLGHFYRGQSIPEYKVRCAHSFVAILPSAREE
jgi:hypothetical protein